MSYASGMFTGSPSMPWRLAEALRSVLSNRTAIGTGLAVLIALVVAAVALHWRSERPVTTDEAATIVQQGDLNVQKMQEHLTDQINSRPTSEVQQRMESETGLGLSRLCIQWTEFADDHPTDENRVNRDRACQRYRDYVQFGTLSEDDVSVEAPAP